MICLEDNPQNRQVAGETLRRGGVVVFATDTLYGLGASVFQPTAVARVFTVKRRALDQGLPVLVGGRDQVEQAAGEVTALAAELMERFWPGPLTLVMRRHPRLPAEVAGGLDTVAVRMPAHSTALGLIATCGTPVTGTSANVSGGPSPASAREGVRQLGDSVDVVLDSGPCGHGIPSTIVDVTTNPPRLLRAGALPLEDLRRVCPVDELVASPT